MVHLAPKKLVLFGAACSPVTDQIAKAARHWNLVQVSQGHGGVFLSNLRNNRVLMIAKIDLSMVA